MAKSRMVVDLRDEVGAYTGSQETGCRRGVGAADTEERRADFCCEAGRE